MIQYYTDLDENILVGVFSVNRSAENIAKVLGKLIDYDFVEAESDEFDDVGEFEHDTVVIASNDFTEDLLEITGKDIKIYLV